MAEQEAVDSAHFYAPRQEFATVEEMPERLQVINESKQFTPHLLEYMRRKWHLADKGFEYNVLAVFGSQSTGKSTLLNRLFATNFDVMDDTQRRQTTKGIWMSLGHDTNALVMDVEGTDGRERGEDQDFERRSALFSLATAEVLLINMWEHQVGLYNGANMGLLKTVFDVNLQLFQTKGSQKTLLLFIIRDHIGATPLSYLQGILTNDLQRLWKELKKPDSFVDSEITDFFDLAFHTLPHKILRPDDFEKELTAFREWFTDRNHASYVFKPAYHKKIPADGYPKFAENIWSKILSDRELDLPSQQQLLAQYRCDEIMTAAMEQFGEVIKPLTPLVETGRSPADLGAQLNSIRAKILEFYDQDACRYHADVYQKKRKQLSDKIADSLNVLFVIELKNITKRTLALFATSVEDTLKTKDGSFVEKVASAKQLALDFFVKAAEAVTLSETSWSFDEERRRLAEELDVQIQQRRQAEIQRTLDEYKKTFQTSLVDETLQILNTPDANLWSRVAKITRDALAQAATSFENKHMSNFEIADEELALLSKQLRNLGWDTLLKKLKEESNETSVVSRLKKKFDEIFRYNEDGLPRVWSPTDDIDGLCRKAKLAAEDLLTVFVRVEVDLKELDITGEPEDLVLLSSAKLAAVRDAFKREVDTVFVEAKRSVVATTAKIPYWLMALLLVLGYNEFMAILTDPIYFFFFIVLGGIGYVLYSMNLLHPLQNAAIAALTDVMKKLTAPTPEAVAHAGGEGRNKPKQH